MLNIGDKLVEAKVPGTEKPSKTTFEDGRLATKEAFNFCKELCARRKLDPPSYMTFKWHVKNGKHLSGELVRNPFGNIPEKIYAIEPEGVIAFVEKLAEQGDKLRVIAETAGNGVIRRTTRPRQTAPTPPPSPTPDPPPSPETSAPSKPTVSAAPPKRLTRKEAYKYFLQEAPQDCGVPETTFGHYLKYRVIDSIMEEGRRYVLTDSIQVYLELFPSGVYAKHQDYIVGLTLKADEMTMADAYKYYASVDPEPVTYGTFRGLVAAAIIPAIRESNSPKAKTVGLRKQDVNSFLALRHRIAEEQREPPPVKKVAKKTPAKSKASPPAPSMASPPAPSKDKEVKIPPGKMYPTDRAFLRFREMVPDLIPRGLSLPEFRNLVRAGLIKRTLKEGVEHVRFDSIVAYFGQSRPEELETWVSLADAFVYYSQKATDPIAKAHFSRLVQDGTIAGARKADGGFFWEIRLADLDAFLKKHPTGRLRANRNSRAAQAVRGKPAPKKKEPENESPEETSAPSRGRVTVRMSDYENPAELAAVLQTLTDQGFQVDVKS